MVWFCVSQNSTAKNINLGIFLVNNEKQNHMMHLWKVFNCEEAISRPQQMTEISDCNEPVLDNILLFFHPEDKV